MQLAMQNHRNGAPQLCHRRSYVQRLLMQDQQPQVRTRMKLGFQVLPLSVLNVIELSCRCRSANFAIGVVWRSTCSSGSATGSAVFR
jgi:hypothetical protein